MLMICMFCLIVTKRGGIAFFICPAAILGSALVASHSCAVYRGSTIYFTQRLQVDKGASINIIVKQRLLLRSVFLFNKLFQAKNKGARIDMDNEAILADRAR